MKLWLFFWVGAWLTYSSLAQDTVTDKNVTTLWQFILPEGESASSPALAPDGTIYVGTFPGWLLALTPDGKVKWKFKAGIEIKSSPAVGADGTIYFGSRDRKFYALTPQGKLKWSFATDAWVDSSPAIAADGTLYFGSWDNNFYALSAEGQLKWKFATGGTVDSSPAVGADGTIYFGSHDKNLYALTPDGKLKWKFATSAQIVASPALAAGGSLYISSTDGNLYALKPDGTEYWRMHTGSYTASTPVLDEQGNLYFYVKAQECSVRPDGKGRWQFDTAPDSTAISAAVIGHGNIFMSEPWSRAGLLTADKKFNWEFQVVHDLSSSPNVSPTGIIYFTAGEFLYAIQPVKEVAPPAKSAWPLWRANPQHTGRVQK